MGRPPFTCDRTVASHEQLTDPQLRTHYQRGCKDDLTRAAIARAKKSKPDLSAPSEGGTAGATAPASTPAQRPVPTPPVAIAMFSSLGTSRRLRGLVRIGFTPAQLAEQLNLNESTVWLLLFWPPEKVKTTTHTTVATLFKRLRDQPQLEGGRPAEYSKLMAETYDWQLPYSWKDIDTDAAPAPAERLPRTDSAEIDMLREQLRDAKSEIKRISGTRKPVATECDHQDVITANTDLNLALVDRDAQLIEARRIADDLTQRVADRTAADEAATLAAEPASDGVALEVAADLVDVDQLHFGFHPSPGGGFTLSVPASVLESSR